MLEKVNEDRNESRPTLTQPKSSPQNYTVQSADDYDDDYRGSQYSGPSFTGTELRQRLNTMEYELLDDKQRR